MRAASWRALAASEAAGGVLKTADGATLPGGAGGGGAGTFELGGGAGRMLGGSGRGLAVALGGAEVPGLERTGGGGGCGLSRGTGLPVKLRCGIGGGLPEGREGSRLELAGRGGSETGRGGSATGFGTTAALGSALLTPARFSLSLGVPSSSPMQALCADRVSIAQIVVPLSNASASPTCLGLARTVRVNASSR